MYFSMTVSKFLEIRRFAGAPSSRFQQYVGMVIIAEPLSPGVVVVEHGQEEVAVEVGVPGHIAHHARHRIGFLC